MTTLKKPIPLRARQQRHPLSRMQPDGRPWRDSKFKSDAENMKKPVLQREINGDASEAAILKCTELNTGNVMAYRARSPRVYKIPFNSNNKYQVSVHETEDKRPY